MTTSHLELTAGKSSHDYQLKLGDEVLASLSIPMCPDDDSFSVSVNKTIALDCEDVDGWISQILPNRKYHVTSILAPICEKTHIYLGQEKVPTFGNMAVLFADGPYFEIEGKRDFRGKSVFADPYYIVAVRENGGSFEGAILLAVCIPDFLLGTNQRGVLLIQIGSSNGKNCTLVVPQEHHFCLCQHSTFHSGDSDVERLNSWYVNTGADGLIQILSSI
jgi:hypothetical protein